MEETHLQALGIDEPFEWSVARDAEVSQFINDHPNQLSRIISDWLTAEAPPLWLLLRLNPESIQRMATDLCNLMIALGYMKGYHRAMEDQILDKLIQ